MIAADGRARTRLARFMSRQAAAVHARLARLMPGKVPSFLGLLLLLEYSWLGTGVTPVTDAEAEQQQQQSRGVFRSGSGGRRRIHAPGRVKRILPARFACDVVASVDPTVSSQVSSRGRRVLATGMGVASSTATRPRHARSFTGRARHGDPRRGVRIVYAPEAEMARRASDQTG